MKKITFVTGNTHKFEEIKNLVSSHFPNITLVQCKQNLIEIQAETLKEVAEYKLHSIKHSIKPPYFIEDSGFFVEDVCNGFPGVYSAYVAKTIGCEGILKIMGDSKERKAYFKTVIAYMDENYNAHFFEGKVEGSVAHEARGSGGFAFDPIFIPDSQENKRTFAELSMEEKNRISNRSRAFMKLMNYLSIM